MENKSQNSKGPRLEELLRAHFIREGYFVVRGVPYYYDGEELTDIDLWLYEQSAAGNPIIQICDIKNKLKSKTIERIFWTKGLAESLGIKTAYVAANEKRSYLGKFSAKFNVHLIDRSAIRLLEEENLVPFNDRIDDETLFEEIKKANEKNYVKVMLHDRESLMSSIPAGFGKLSLIGALRTFKKHAIESVNLHPDSSAAKLSGRLSYFAAAIACISLDKICIEVPFRTLPDCEEHIRNVIRSGEIQNGDSYNVFERATKLVEKYLGHSPAFAMKNKLLKDIEKIPAEIIAKQSVRLQSSKELFNVAREFEMASYRRQLPTFDDLPVPTKSMLGALLDYSMVSRERFANAWKFAQSNETSSSKHSESKDNSGKNQNSRVDKNILEKNQVTPALEYNLT